MENFIQTSSILRRLQLLIYSTAFFFLAAFIVVYLTSRSSLEGLMHVNEANNLFNLTNQISESLDTGTQILDSRSGKRTEDTRLAFQAAQKQAFDRFRQAIESSKPFPEAEKYLLEAQTATEQLNLMGRRLLQVSKIEAKTPQLTARRDRLIIAQYELDAKEGLRKAQIALKRHSDESFNSAFQMRYRPLIVGITLAILCFAFVGIVGLSITQRLTRSVQHLIQATDAVSHGNLRYQAPIMSSDEIGKVTAAFNEMVKRLELGTQRTTRLQAITASFSEALDPDQVADVVIHQGLEAVGAAAGAIAMITEGGEQIELLRARGYSPEQLERWRRFPSDANMSLAEVIRTRAPLWLETREKLEQWSADSNGLKLTDFPALVSLPLIAEGQAIGSIAFSFSESKHFTHDDKEYFLSLTRICAQALRRSKLYLEAQEAVRVREEFLSIASHELKTPLTPLQIQVQGLARIVDQGKLLTTPPEQISRTLLSMKNQINRLNRLVEELLDVARIGTGKLTLEREPVELSSLVKEIVDQFEHELKLARCPVQLDLKSNVVGQWDRFRLEQAITNLLTNAIRYGSGKPIDIAVHSNNGTAQLKVRDYGVGIAENDLQRIFGRFERAAPAKHMGGLGLGLYITRQIVEQHAGKISVESQIDQGSTFAIHLPKEPPTEIDNLTA